MGAPLTVGSLEALAVRLQGRWWFADEEDNPFGLAMLVAPSQGSVAYQPQRRNYKKEKIIEKLFQEKKLNTFRMELYTLAEARMKRSKPWRDCSKIYAEPPRSKILLRFGWNLFYGDRQLEANLPIRFTSENVAAFLKDRDALRKSLLSAQPTIARFSNFFKRKSAMEKALVEWREQLERKRRGVDYEESSRERATGES